MMHDWCVTLRCRGFYSLQNDLVTSLRNDKLWFRVHYILASEGDTDNVRVLFPAPAGHERD